MIINLVLYSSESLKRILKRTVTFFEKNNEIRLSNNTIWLSNIYIKFSNRIITINVFNLNSNWKSLLKEYLSDVLENEEVFISDDTNLSQYFEIITKQTNIESAYLKNVV